MGRTAGRRDDETYNNSLALIEAAQQDCDTLRADADSDPLDVASAAQHLHWLKEMVLPKQTPAERWYPALREATERREAAAGGPRCTPCERVSERARSASSSSWSAGPRTLLLGAMGAAHAKRETLALRGQGADTRASSGL